MIICKNCGVELEPVMEFCPLCNQPVESGDGKPSVTAHEKTRASSYSDGITMNRPQRKAIWELVSVILVLIIIITSLINYVVNGKISWSEYPVATSLVLFSYITFFAFLERSREVKVLFVWISSSLLIFLLDITTGQPLWAWRLGIPLLFYVNIIIVGLIEVIKFSKERGVNLIAYFFLAAALFCIGIEFTIDHYLGTHTRLVWSLIVSACVVPIATILLFMHFRLKKGRNLKKTFHI